jgi:4-diphosphocytidyl-2-C-methyl-D-erythritol kinase
MAVAVRSFAKINLGLCIGARRTDGFHELRTIYQTISLHDLVRVDVQRGTGIEVRSKDPRVPTDESNTCWRVAERVMKSAKGRGKVVITIDKRLPVQGGMGAASSNAVATMLALERALGQALESEERLRIAAEVGSDLPLFLIGGTMLGIGRGEEVFALQDRPPMDLVLALPPVGVSTPQAFAVWDRQFGTGSKLTAAGESCRMNQFSRAVFAWLTASTTAGVPPAKGGDRAETPLLDLVRAGIENDFERVVFLKYPELREVKRVLERAGARYASLSGSGSTLYGLFDSPAQAQAAAEAISASGTPAVAATTITREQYWRELFNL